METLLKLIVLVLFLGWRGFWWITEKKADKEKPKTKLRRGIFENVSRFANLIAGGFIGLQLLGIITILPISDMQLVWQIGGMVLVIVGFYICMKARVDLGTNWANSYDYQIKKHQELITHGVYKYIRHPIYTGLVFMYIGAEMVALSYLFFPSILLFIWSYIQARKEEKLLLKYFGKKYEEYMKRSKMLIPFIY